MITLSKLKGTITFFLVFIYIFFFEFFFMTLKLKILKTNHYIHYVHKGYICTTAPEKK